MASTSTTAELAGLFDDLVRCETRLYNALTDRMRSEHGLAATQFEFLRYFEAHPGARVADVASNFAAGIGAISKGVDRLEKAGWVMRHPNPADGRSSLVSLTSAGAALVAEARATFEGFLADLLGDHLDGDQASASAAALRILRGALERDRIGVPVG